MHLTNKNHREFLELAAQDFPEMTRLWNIRRILPANGWTNPLVIQSALLSHALYVKDTPELFGTMANTLIIGCWMAVHRWPTYFVGRDLAHALINTEPSPDLRWSDIRWAVPAIQFCLPDDREFRQWLNSPEGVPNICCGLVERPPSGTPVQIQELLSRITMPGQAPGVHIKRVTLCSYYQDARIQTPVIHEMTAKMEWTLSQTYAAPTEDAGEEVGMEVVEEDRERMRRMIRLTINLLVFLSTEHPQAKPEMGQLLRKAQHKGKREVPEMWAPNWIGRTYHLPSKNTGEGHASPRLHLRRGHLRHQRFGAGRQQIRIIWIEPTWVGLEPSDETPDQNQNAE